MLGSNNLFFIWVILFLQTVLVRGHTYGYVAGTTDQTVNQQNLCAEDDIYIFVGTNHGWMGDSCFRYQDGGRVDVNTDTPFSKRPSVNNVMAYSSLVNVPNCIGPTATSSNSICNANNQAPNHHPYSSYTDKEIFRYGPINQNSATARTYTASIYNFCDCFSNYCGISRTFSFTTKICSCQVAGQGLTNEVCTACPIGQSAATARSSCAPCTAGKYQDQNAASSWGCKTWYVSFF